MKLSEISYKRITLEEIREKAKSYFDKFDKAKNAEEQFKVYHAYNEHASGLGTNFSLLNIRYTQNTADEFYAKEKDYLDEIGPYVQQLNQQFSDRLLESKFKKDLVKLIPEIIFTKLEYSKKTFNDKILEDLQEENRLETEYSKFTAAALIEFNGEKLTLSQMGKHRQSADRDVRRAAFTAQGKWLEGAAEKLDEIFDKLVKIRHKIAQKLGFSNFVELAHYRMGRLGYTRADLHAYRKQVQTDLVPLVAKVKEAQAKRLGIPEITLIDDSTCFKQGNPTPVGTPEEIFQNGKKMYHELSQDTGEFIDFMLKHELFDVLSRKNKANGGYCTTLDAYKMPFIFANFNGTAGDIDVLTHEAGHALASYKAFDIPWHDLRHYSMETAEVHSMSMEFFAEKWMELFFGGRADDYRLFHLSSSLCFIPYGTVVDYFQELIYLKPEMTPAERNETFKKLVQEFCPQLSGGEIPGYRDGRRWQLQLHIYEYPFYYIDYCLAQTVALQFYAAMQKDFNGAWKQYMKFLTSAGTKSFPDTVKYAGLNTPFKDGTLKQITEKVQHSLLK